MAVKNGWPDDALGGLYPFKDKWVTLDDGHDMHYIEAGRAGRVRPTFLLLHGNPTWSFLWREFMAPLAKLGRVVAVDHVGFGRSDHPTDPAYHSLERHIQNLQEFVRKARIRRAIPVVQDWGGPIGLGFAARQPSDIAGVVVLNSWAFTRREQVRMPWWFKAMRSKGIGEMLYQKRNLYVDRYMPRFTHSPLRPPVLAAYQHPFPTPGSRAGIVAWARMVPDGPKHPDWSTLSAVEDALPDLDVPALILWAARDPAFPKRFAWAFHELMPNAEEPVFLDGAGHFLQEDAAQEIITRIRDWAVA